MQTNKLALRNQLENLGIKIIEGNYIRKSDLEKLVSQLNTTGITALVRVAGGGGFKDFNDPWKAMSPEDRKEANRLFKLVMKAYPSSPKQKELSEKLNTILKKYKIGQSNQDRVLINTSAFEVDAGFKEILKKLGQILLGVIVISQTAFGYQLQKVDRLGALMDKSVKSIAKEYKVDGNYAVKAKETKKGNVQYVTFNFEKDGKTVATVEFAGTKETSFKDDYNVSTTIKSDDKVAEEVATILHDILQKPKGL